MGSGWLWLWCGLWCRPNVIRLGFGRFIRGLGDFCSFCLRSIVFWYIRSQFAGEIIPGIIVFLRFVVRHQRYVLFFLGTSLSQATCSCSGAVGGSLADLKNHSSPWQPSWEVASGGTSTPRGRHRSAYRMQEKAKPGHLSYPGFLAMPHSTPISLILPAYFRLISIDPLSATLNRGWL